MLKHAIIITVLNKGNKTDHNDHEAPRATISIYASKILAKSLPFSYFSFRRLRKRRQPELMVKRSQSQQTEDSIWSVPFISCVTLEKLLL